MAEAETKRTVRSLFENVVVAIDDSETSLEAIDAIGPSVKAANGKMAVVFVRHMPVMFDSLGVDSADAWGLVEESIESREQNAERDATEHVKKFGVPATFVVREGDPAREILAVAKDHDASAVAIGSTVHGVIGSILVSSVTEYLVHHCPLPLLIIRPLN